MIDVIVKALNKWLEANNLTQRGWFIGRTFKDKTAFGPYKKMTGEIYYHIENKNILMLDCTVTINALQPTEAQIDNLYSNLIWSAFTQLEDIKKKVQDVEQIPNAI